ncbi:MAG: HEAT repeat domain-containing protein, partial [Candidatus Zixiibacteriota bacterium]
LIMMADDPIKEIRESAVIAVGLIGTPEIAPQLFDLARRNPSVAVRVVSALGKIGGEEVRAYLVRLLEDEKELSKMASGQVSKEELRLAAVKSLGNIGDKKSIAALKGYKDNLPATQNIFFKKSPVNKAIVEILSKR